MSGLILKGKLTIGDRIEIPVPDNFEIRVGEVVYVAGEIAVAGPGAEISASWIGPARTDPYADPDYNSAFRRRPVPPVSPATNEWDRQAVPEEIDEAALHDLNGRNFERIGCKWPALDAGDLAHFKGLRRIYSGELVEGGAGGRLVGYGRVDK